MGRVDFKDLKVVIQLGAEAPAPPPAPNKQEKLLEEIRDLLKK